MVFLSNKLPSPVNNKSAQNFLNTYIPYPIPGISNSPSDPTSFSDQVPKERHTHVRRNLRSSNLYEARNSVSETLLLTMLRNSPSILTEPFSKGGNVTKHRCELARLVSSGRAPILYPRRGGGSGSACLHKARFSTETENANRLWELFWGGEGERVARNVYGSPSSLG